MNLALHVDFLSVGVLGGCQQDSWHLPSLMGGANGGDVLHYVGIGLCLSFVPVLNGIVVMLECEGAYVCRVCVCVCVCT